MPAPGNGAVERIGIEIRTMRKEYMLTQQQLAGSSDRTLRDIEADREGPSIGTVVKVLSTLASIWR